jgi:hypothetical protein
MRSVPFERLKELLNPVPPAIGLVGAAVTNYPWIKDRPPLSKHSLEELPNGELKFKLKTPQE